MLGAIIGDMVGSPFEFDENNIKTCDFPLWNEGTRFTDDSVMTVATGRALMDVLGDEGLNEPSAQGSATDGAPSDDTYRFVPLTLVCSPDSASLLRCVATDGNGTSTTIYLRKVTHRQD